MHLGRERRHDRKGRSSDYTLVSWIAHIHNTAKINNLPRNRVKINAKTFLRFNVAINDEG